MTRLTVFAIALLTLIGCDSSEEAGPLAAGPKAAAKPVTGQAKKPVAPLYTIISDEDVSPVRRAVDVKIYSKVTPEVLREIALKVKAREERPHERTAIFYYLPVDFAELSGLPWASSHFNPEVKVKILGLSKEDEDRLRSMKLEHKGKRIGAWLQDNQYKSLDLIYEVDGVIKIAEIRSPTERSDSDMVEMPTTKGRSFRKVKGSNHYDVDSFGNLRISNIEGQVISAAKPID
jgi:hypothetical protein